MEAQPFVIERILNAPLDRVWRAISERDEMAKWYFDLADFRPEVGFEFEFTGGTEENKYLHKCQVTKAEPNKILAYTWRYEGYDGLSEVIWELFPQGDQTLLRLTHTGLDTFPALGDFARSNFETGWTYIIGTSLINYLEPKEL